MLSSNRENRKFTRYALLKSATFTCESATRPPSVYKLFIHDLSCGGALVSSTTQIPDNTNLRIGIRVQHQQKLFGQDEVEFLFRGKVIRREKSGRVAIVFEKDYRINRSLPL